MTIGIAANPRAITRELAAYALSPHNLVAPHHIQTEAVRTHLNWFGCALGGSHEAVTVNALSALGSSHSPANQSIVIGHCDRIDMASAAFLNCASSSALAYDDTHLGSVTHPTGPVAAALFAYAETTTVSGRDYLAALAVGIEIECRMSNVLLLPPAIANLSLYITGVTGPIGAAAAVGRLMGLDQQKLCWSIGHAAAQGAGPRATHAAMSAAVVPAFAARAGVFAAQLAAAGVDCREDVLEGQKGFVEIFAEGADLSHAVDGLGERFELLANAYKPYPCGIVVQPAVDACMDLAGQIGDSGQIEHIRLAMHPLALRLCDRQHPRTPYEAQVSLQHWVAAVLAGRPAGIPLLRQEAIDHPEIKALRNKIQACSNPDVRRDQAEVEVLLSDGRRLKTFVEHARGSLARPMTDEESDAKFLDQAKLVYSAEKANRLLDRLHNIAAIEDVGKSIVTALCDG